MSEQSTGRNILEILRLLPHRYPFLLVDRIVSMTEGPVAAGSKVTGLKNVSVNEPFFQGHFPGNPVMPGVLVLECMAQVGGCLFFAGEAEPEKKLMYLSGIDKARFRRPVFPGDQLVVVAEILQVRSTLVRMRAEARVDGALCAEGEFMSSLVERPSAAR
ncbi:MAG TPA: 3-hydroxyacyl-ACP dehydratase FabZ [Thermoanaerobaculia bacterium]|nr:3-hydroxyacyl-ACP dehydratase FabZ [Thermoanaerobaculia bacterium]